MLRLFGSRKRGQERQNGGGEAVRDIPVEPGGPFFVPGVDERGRAEQTLEEVRERLARVLQSPVTDEAFAAVNYEHDGFSYRAEVGVADPRANETVRAILRQPEKYRFLIVTERHGFAGGLPLLVQEREIRSATVFRDA